MPTLNTKVNTQKARINELEKSAYQVDELTKENAKWTRPRLMLLMSSRHPNPTMMSWEISTLRAFTTFMSKLFLFS